MKVEIISRETIKPSSPTPPHLRTFKFSLLDQTNPLAYVPFVLFYPASKDDEGKTDQTAKLRSDQLKKSLPETLTRFYPFAGRIKDDFSMDCNDEGVDFFEAKVDCELSKVLRDLELEVLDRFLPCASATTELHKMVQVAIQVTTFDCGGLVIGLCLLHKIIDASSLTTFLKDWATSVANGGSTNSTEAGALDPIFFIQDSLFPPIDLSSSFSQITTTYFPKLDRITKTRRFVFDGPNIAALKAKVTMTNNSSSNCVKKKNPTRVQVVSSLLMQRIMAASTRSKSSSKKVFLANHSVNMRSRTVPPLPENSIGNFVFVATVSSSIEDKNELHELVGQLDEAIGNLNDDYIRKLQANDKWAFEDMEQFNENYSREEVFCFFFTSWCRFPLYETDFGWGKPAFVTSFSSKALALAKIVFLMDTKLGDGIEAWVRLDEEIMDSLERDNDFLEFARLNPSALE